MENKTIVADELLDADLKQILGKRYQDMSDKFTPEAQERRRNNREVFTLKPPHEHYTSSITFTLLFPLRVFT